MDTGEHVPAWRMHMNTLMCTHTCTHACLLTRTHSHWSCESRNSRETRQPRFSTCDAACPTGGSAPADTLGHCDGGRALSLPATRGHHRPWPSGITAGGSGRVAVRLGLCRVRSCSRTGRRSGSRSEPRPPRSEPRGSNSPPHPPARGERLRHNFILNTVLAGDGGPKYQIYGGNRSGAAPGKSRRGPRSPLPGDGPAGAAGRGKRVCPRGDFLRNWAHNSRPPSSVCVSNGGRTASSGDNTRALGVPGPAPSTPAPPPHTPTPPPGPRPALRLTCGFSGSCPVSPIDAPGDWASPPQGPAGLPSAFPASGPVRPALCR